MSKPSNAETETTQSTDSPEPNADVNTVQQAQANERSRIQAITGHAEAQGREKLANHLAFTTDMSVEEAGNVLAAAEKTPSTDLDAQHSLDALMSAEEQPNLTSDVDDSAEPVTDLVAEGAAAYRTMKGIKDA